jgi:hypothetical protein
MVRPQSMRENVPFSLIAGRDATCCSYSWEEVFQRVPSGRDRESWLDSMVTAGVNPAYSPRICMGLTSLGLAQV